MLANAQIVKPVLASYPGAGGQLCGQQTQPEYLNNFCPSSQPNAEPGVTARMPHFSPPGGWYPCKTVLQADKMTPVLERYSPKYLSVAHSSIKELSRGTTACCNEPINLLRVCVLFLGQIWTELRGSSTLFLKEHLNLNCYQAKNSCCGLEEKRPRVFTCLSLFSWLCR